MPRLKGSKLSEETKRKISIAKKGQIPWNKGKKCPQISLQLKGRLSLRKGKTKYLSETSLEEWRERKRISGRKYAGTTRKLRRKFRRQTDPKFRLDSNVSAKISNCLKSEKVFRKWEDLVGYSIENLMCHLEKQFDDKMNWDNYGSYWSVDHIKPKSLFKYITAEDPEFKKCWALENLQPLEKIANIKKGRREEVKEMYFL